MKLWINGKWCDGTEGVLTVENPATGETIAQVAKAVAANVDKAVAAAKAAGAGILCGGELLDGPGYFYAPTVINNVAQTSEIGQKEVFGLFLKYHRVVCYEFKFDKKW